MTWLQNRPRHEAARATRVGGGPDLPCSEAYDTHAGSMLMTLVLLAVRSSLTIDKIATLVVLLVATLLIPILLIAIILLVAVLYSTYN